MTSWTTAKQIPAAGVSLNGDLTLPAHAGGLVLSVADDDLNRIAGLRWAQPHQRDVTLAEP